IRLRKADGKTVEVAIFQISAEDQEYLAARTNPRPAPRDNAGKPFVLDGVLSIDAPPGFAWRQASAGQEEGVKTYVLMCEKPGAADVVTLLVQQYAADTDAARLTAIGAQHGALMETLAAAGFTELKSTPPPTTVPVPAAVSFAANGKRRDGQPVEIRAAAVFGKNVYGYSVIADTAAEADRLLAVIRSLRESP
ncbi:MAG: hypothetical protein KDA41_17835, partial [Planctomycetales bacterium]|nr:hypothetical protein [Planctomycetales bacterium]